MKRRNVFLFVLLSAIAALILLSGCASKDAGRQDDVTALPNTSEAANDPGENVSPAPGEADDQADAEEKPAMIMGVGVWTPYPDTVNRKYDELGFTKYTLTQEDADRVIAVFESAEKEPLDSPIADFTELYFQFGENYLEAPIADLDPFRGSLDGKRVVFTLDEEGCNVIWEIVFRYAGVTGEDVYETPENPLVAMNIWSYDTGEEFTYTLTPEDSSRVIAIFESAEKEFPNSPAANVESMEFVYNENSLGTAPEDIETIIGYLNGRYVCLELNEAACIELRQIITKYASPDMPNEWPNTPSAGEE